MYRQKRSVCTNWCDSEGWSIAHCLDDGWNSEYSWEWGSGKHSTIWTMLYMLFSTSSLIKLYVWSSLVHRCECAHHTRARKCDKINWTISDFLLPLLWYKRPTLVEDQWNTVSIIRSTIWAQVNLQWTAGGSTRTFESC